MAKADIIFKNMCTNIIENGTNTQGEKVRPIWPDTGEKAYTIKLFGQTAVYDLREEFPALTFRRTAIKSAINADFNSYDNTASFYLAAGEEKTVTVEFDTTTPVTGMNIFIDSGIWMDEGLRQNHSGNVTISNATFSK